MISLAWLRIERVPMMWFDLLPGALLMFGGTALITMGILGLVTFQL
jgi:hypothetical protein